MKNILSDMFWWFNHRTFKRFNIVRTGLKPGYYDKDILMVHANFSLLVDYVEIELGGLEEIFSEESKMQKFRRILNRILPIFPTARNRKAALKFLYKNGNDRDDDGNLTVQAKHYREVEELYYWWTSTYPKLEKKYDNTTSMEVEDEIEEEIDRQLVRLITIRSGMWT